MVITSMREGKVLPAQAGMIPIKAGQDLSAEGSTRASGDDPDEGKEKVITYTFYPRKRG